MLKVLHISDIHVHAPLRLLGHHDFASKRLAGGINLALRRAKLFRHIEEQLNDLARLARDKQVDAVVCTGDYTALGSTEEMMQAREWMQPLIDASPHFITMPGNHDVYTYRAVAEQRFEQAFGEFLVSDEPANPAASHPYPLIRHLSGQCSVIVLNSSIPHRAFWRSDGYISDDQLEQLQERLARPDMHSRSVVIATHYAPYKGNAQPDSPRHGLRNAEALMSILRTHLHRGFLIHGHIHHRYYLSAELVGVPIFCSGSSTHQGREGIWLYDISASHCRAYPGTWHEDHYHLETSPITVTLGPSPTLPTTASESITS